MWMKLLRATAGRMALSIKKPNTDTVSQTNMNIAGAHTGIAET